MKLYQFNLLSLLWNALTNILANVLEPSAITVILKDLRDSATLAVSLALITNLNVLSKLVVPPSNVVLNVLDPVESIKLES